MKPSDIQKLAETRLRQFPAFTGIRIILEREGDIGTKIATALKTAGGEFQPGAALIIGTASASIRGVQAPRLVIDPLSVTVTACESELFNKPPSGTGRRAGDLALEAASALLGWTPPGCSRPLSPGVSPHTGVYNVQEASDNKGSAVAAVTLTTSLELPLLRLDGEYGYTNPTP